MDQPTKFSFSDFLVPLFSALDRFTQSPHWRVKTVALCVLCMGLFQFPDYRSLYAYAVVHTESNDAYDTFAQQVAHPLAAHPADYGSHESKMAFRLALPLLARALHLNIFGVLVLQVLAGVLMLWALLTLCERLTLDRPTALLLVLGACCTYFGGAFLHDVFCYFDAFGYAVLVLLLLSRRPAVIYGLSVAGAFLDERVAVASLLVLLWHSLRLPAETVPQLRRPAATWAGAAVVAGWLTYAGLRWWLGAAHGLRTDGGGVGLEALRLNLLHKNAALGFLTGLESFWLLVALAVLVLAARRQGLLAAALVLAFGPVAGGSFLVFDITRSLAYGFPAVLLALVVLTHYFTRHALRHIALVVCAVAVLIPNYALHGQVSYAESLFEKILRTLLAAT